MKKIFKRIFSFSAALIVLAGAMTGARAAELTPTVSDNADNRYVATNYTMPDTSALYRDGDHLVRVEKVNGSVIIEHYDDEFAITDQRSIEMELPIWGGFFAGAQYNFLVFGQENPEEDDSVEVIRVVKYDKDWNRLGAASLRGENTTIPFDAGGLDCAEKDGVLYIHTSHEMYTSSDGLNHQSNLTFSVRESDMTVTACRSNVSYISTGYVSHSFQQRIMVDSEGRIVTADHGDAYPRSIVLCRYNGDIADGCEYVNVQVFPGEIGANATGASLGSLTETDDHYIVTYNYDGIGDNSGGRGIYMATVKKSDLSVTVKEITKPAGSKNFGDTVPYAVSTGNGGYILWNSYSQNKNDGYLSYVTYDADGNISEITRNTMDLPMLSDCRPVYDNGKVVWYTTRNSEPQFFLVDETGVNVEPFDEAAHTLGTVTISGLLEPMPEELAFDNTVAVSEGVSCSVKWSDTDGNILSSSDKFETGGVYTTTITVKPLYKYSFAEDVTFTVNGEAWDVKQQDGGYVLTKTYPALKPIHLVKVSFYGAYEIEVPKSSPYETATASLTLNTTGYYSDDSISPVNPGDEIQLEEIVMTPEWYFVDERPDGVSLDKNVLTVTNRAKEGTVWVGVCVGSIKVERLIYIERGSSYLASAHIEENGAGLTSASITIPASGSVSHSFEGVVYDQYGVPVDDNAQWYIVGGDPAGVQCSFDGVITVTSDAEACQFELMFASPNSGSIRDSITVTLVKSSETSPDTPTGEKDDGASTPSIDESGNTTPSESEKDDAAPDNSEDSSENSTNTPGSSASAPDKDNGENAPDTDRDETGDASENEKPEDSADPLPEDTFAFSDVSESSYCFDAVKWAVENGITNGTSDTTFSPASSCTRAQIVTFLWRAAGSPEPISDENPFADVAETSPYYKAILWAYSTGLTRGTDTDAFSPDDTCTRAQAVTMLWRLGGEDAKAADTGFADVAENSYYNGAVAWAVENSVTNGTGKGTFSPDKTCTRGEIVTFLWRAMAK